MDKKLKVAIITIFDNFNNGTYLQAFATSYLIEKLGFEVLFVDYCRSFNGYLTFWKKLWRNPIKQFFAYKKLVKRRKDMQRIVTSNFTTTIPYVGYESLEKNPPLADIYLTGSDQVWNTIHNHGVDKAFFWGEIETQDSNIVSYAASIGLDDFADDDKKQIKSLLSKFSSISVREKKAVDILNNMGIESTLVLDPTLLLNKEEWLSSLNIVNKPMPYPYILYYSVETSEQEVLLEIIARKISSRLNMPILQMCFGKAVKNDFVTDYVEDPLPKDFISLMAHASFVIACSFHGTAFSINFNKPFVSVVPVKYSSRAMSLLNEFNLNRHFITEESQINDEVIYNVDYVKVNAILDEKRKLSKGFLNQALNAEYKKK